VTSDLASHGDEATPYFCSHVHGTDVKSEFKPEGIVKGHRFDRRGFRFCSPIPPYDWALLEIAEYPVLSLC
jgi:hypothetical protein